MVSLDFIKEMNVVSSSGKGIEEILKDYLDTLEESIELQKKENSNSQERISSRKNQTDRIDQLNDVIRKKKLQLDFKALKERTDEDLSTLEAMMNNLMKEDL